MTPFYSDANKRRIDIYKEFQSLWKSEDPEWVAQRKKEWQEIAGDIITVDYKFIARYYVYGEEPPSRIDGDGTFDQHVVEFYFKHRLAFTPFETIAQVQRLWDVEVEYFGGKDHAHGMGAFIYSMIGGLQDKTEHCRRVKLITEALYCEKYFCIEKEYGNGLSNDFLSVKPRDFVISYSGLGLFSNVHAHIDSSFQCFSLAYFLKCVAYCEEHNSLKTPMQKKCLTKMFIKLLAQEDYQLNSFRLNLKNDLIAAAEDENAPGILKQALIKARASD